MTKQSKTEQTKAGNAFVYILLAVVLFGALSITLSRGQNNDETSELDEAKIELYANSIIEYAATAQQVVDQMLMTGATIDDINLVLPSDAAFETDSDIYKLYHPDGGGLNFKTMPDEYEGDAGFAPGFLVGNTVNFEWTESSATEIIFMAAGIKQSICANINKKITGASTIPQGLTLSSGDFDTAYCPECEGYPALCVEDAVGNPGLYFYYQILAAR